MKTLTLLTILAPGVAQAHTGHVGEVAGHDHWVAGAAIGVAIGLSLWAIWKEKGARARSEDEASDQDEAGADAEEQQA
ncbi:DUF6732 family protein [Tranquillimonas alkanivorans]|uniref:HupE / UreJ protein n=1 Tax=Tranquillimonas alkanivorans TaxID=441119 RepID=A0A1I5KMM5_9RHOB|nr:DUF6732 family protein [Tranquillimonas alkanivorans]SFO86083.1 hypothetical protein SAMN04488047_101199 [Tranquillimonas alkanivorans]